VQLELKSKLHDFVAGHGCVHWQQKWCNIWELQHALATKIMQLMIMIISNDHLEIINLLEFRMFIYHCTRKYNGTNLLILFHIDRNCSAVGTMNKSNTCDASKGGRCPCKTNIDGQTCNKCKVHT
jgi:hypothetical protein